MSASRRYSSGTYVTDEACRVPVPGYEILEELSGAQLVGWTYDGPFDELPAQGHPSGYPAEIAEVVRKQQWAPERPARELHLRQDLSRFDRRRQVCEEELAGRDGADRPQRRLPLVRPGRPVADRELRLSRDPR